MFQAITASWPARAVSELAKHGPVYTWHVRVSRYLPLISPAEASAGSTSTAIASAKRTMTVSSKGRFRLPGGT
jgi:hypothetical protein